MKKLTALLLFLLSVAAAVTLTACDKPGEGPGNETEPPPAEAAKLELIVNGSTGYVVMRPELAGTTVSSAAAKLRTAIAKASGADVEIATDYSKDGTVPTDTLEILVGNTNRPESAEALAKLGENEYSISVIGKRVVIAGANDDAVALGTRVFIEKVLGGLDNGTLTNLSIETDKTLKGVYVKPEDPHTPEIEVIPVQNKPTTSPEKYAVPAIKKENGLYVQTYEPQDITGVRTTFQSNMGYSDLFAIDSDAVMVYATNSGTFLGWYENGDFVVDMMLAINRADQSYLGLDKSHYEDIQMNASGGYLAHGTGDGDGSYYMVPTEDWIEFAWANMIRPMIEACHPQTIAMEEPEMWLSSGYSESFKREWKEYYGEDWQAPNSSAEATLKSNLLKTYLFERIITVLSTRIKDLCPSTQVYIATHSTLNYTLWNIDAGLNHYVATGLIDGVIGQTWTDTTGSAFPYSGKSVKDHFTAAYLDYISYVGSCEGTSFYALADPMCDSSSLTEEDCRYAYRQAVSASLLVPEIHRFEVLPWVQRAYANVSAEYRTVQSQVYEVLNGISGKEVTLRAGTPDITYLVSDSLSWMNTGKGFTLSTTDSLFGVCAPLVRDGIPLKMKAMDQLTSGDDLKNSAVVIVSFDSSVPLSEKVNQALAEYVKGGGTLLCITGSNQYWDISDYFFWKEDGSPLNNLLVHLGLDKKIKVGTVEGSKVDLKSAVDEINSTINGVKLTGTAKNFALSFTGASEVILSAGTTPIGFDEKVGSGSFICVGIPSACCATGTEAGQNFVRALTEYALGCTDYDYVSANLMVADRGDYTIAHAFKKDDKLTGRYIDLFSESLTVLENPTVPKEDSLILRDITDFDLSIPRLGFTSGELISEVSETAAKMTYKIQSASNTVIGNRILLPKGTYPSKVTVVRDGAETQVYDYVYDEKTSSCFFRFEGNVKENEVTVTFGNKQETIGIGAVTFRLVEYLTNSNEADKKYIFSDTAHKNASVRFCDSGEVVYKFDLNEYDNMYFSFFISQNYLAQISPDGKNWTTVADYSEGGKVPRIQNGSNAIILTIDPVTYDFLDDTLYVKFANTVSGTVGFGCAITKFTIRYTVPADKIELKGRAMGNNNTTDFNNVGNYVPTVADESKYLVSKNEATGLATYRRRMATNINNEDEEFIEFNTACVNDGLRYCDQDRVLIYAFDVTGMETAKFSFTLFQNYYFEVSCDGEDYELIADYSEGGTKPHLTTGNNRKTFYIDPFDYCAGETGMLYVRLSNTDPSQGWGGSITEMTLEYTRKIK
ncbi:MAG: hypothetical protein MJ070_05345 [Lachnospiraceae bacterium]|nr:hypothetical protein [Lachnospiraceae bacterium]